MAGVIQTAAQKSVEGKPRKTMQQYIKAMEGEIAKALPSVITPERFTRMVLSAISTNPKLGDCTPQSFLGAMMTAAQLGVEPNTALGQAYIIPYRNKGVLEASFQLGYKGLIDLAYRSGDVSIIQAQTVYENDTFDYELGLDPKLKHIPAVKDRGNATHYYAIFKTKDGGYGFEVMPQLRRGGFYPEVHKLRILRFPDGSSGLPLLRLVGDRHRYLLPPLRAVRRGNLLLRLRAEPPRALPRASYLQF